MEKKTTPDALTGAKPSWWRSCEYLLALVVALPVWVACWYLAGARPLDVQLTSGLLLLAFAYPVLEEVVFRGLVQGSLQRVPVLARIRWGLSLANLVTSVSFAVIHVVVRGELLAALVFAPSLVFGYFFDRFGRLGPCIALHVIYNIGYVVAVGWHA